MLGNVADASASKYEVVKAAICWTTGIRIVVWHLPGRAVGRGRQTAQIEAARVMSRDSDEGKIWIRITPAIEYSAGAAGVCWLGKGIPGVWLPDFCQVVRW